MKSDIKVMKAQADTIGIKFQFTYDVVKFRSKIKTELLNSGIEIGSFSKAKWGKDSEESKIEKAFLEMINEAQIIDKKTSTYF